MSMDFLKFNQEQAGLDTDSGGGFSGFYPIKIGYIRVFRKPNQPQFSISFAFSIPTRGKSYISKVINLVTKKGEKNDGGLALWNDFLYLTGKTDVKPEINTINDRFGNEIEILYGYEESKVHAWIRFVQEWNSNRNKWFSQFEIKRFFNEDGNTVREVKQKSDFGKTLKKYTNTPKRYGNAWYWNGNYYTEEPEMQPDDSIFEDAVPF